MRSMNRLYAVALAVTGGLFMVMSGPSLGETSGKFAFGAGDNMPDFIRCVVVLDEGNGFNRCRTMVNQPP